MNEPKTVSSRQAHAALLTPSGRGAVATIRFEGDCSLIDAAEPPLFRAANEQPLAGQQVKRIVFGHWGPTTPEEVVVCRTGDDLLEIHCHGGMAAVGRILADLASLGCCIETWQTNVSRRQGTFETECLECVTRAATLRTAGILLEQQTGVLRSALEKLLAQAAGESDRSDLRAAVDRLLQWSDFGLHLSAPWTVVLLGRPNVGKSSLMNALLGHSRSIVYDQPGTTRDVLRAETAFEGWPLHLVDTAGLRAGTDELEIAGISLAKSEIERADCRLLLLDVSLPPQDDDRQLLEQWPDAIAVAHKWDLPNIWGAELPEAAVRVSSLSGTGLADLARALVERLVPQVPPAGTAIPVTRRQIDLLEQAREAMERDAWPAFRASIEKCLS